MTGFTFEIDGEPEAVRRLCDALAKEYGAILREVQRDRDTTVLGGVGPMVFYTRPLSPVHGKITFRQ